MMFISVTLPAKYYCNGCDSLLHDLKLQLQCKGRYYTVRDVCPLCESDKVETALSYKMRRRQERTGEVDERHQVYDAQ
jgi:hypothetical protein